MRRENIYEIWKFAIKWYCEQNDLDFDKLQKCVRSVGKDIVIFQHHDSEKGKQGLLDETPASAVLIVRWKWEGLSFEQTEFTQQYLS